MLDSTRLAKITVTDKTGKRHKLHKEFSKVGGILCDNMGYIAPHKVRQLYMMAGILSPSNDSAEIIMESVIKNVLLLNAYFESMNR